MKEYKVKMYKGFDSKEFYAEAESAQELQKEIESKMAFEIYEGMRYKISVISQ